MTYIIVVRNPRTKRLRAILKEADGGVIAEFDTLELAREVARTHPLCRRWGFGVVEINDF